MEMLPETIENEEENERALEIVNSLMNKGEENLTPKERTKIDRLVLLIEDYENRTIEIF